MRRKHLVALGDDRLPTWRRSPESCEAAAVVHRIVVGSKAVVVVRAAVVHLTTGLDRVQVRAADSLVDKR